MNKYMYKAKFTAIKSILNAPASLSVAMVTVHCRFKTCSFPHYLIVTKLYDLFRNKLLFNYYKHRKYSLKLLG